MWYYENGELPSFLLINFEVGLSAKGCMEECFLDSDLLVLLFDFIIPLG